MLKVPTQNIDMMPMGDEQMPPMGTEEDMMGSNTMNGEETQMPSDFDTNFDAGVEADEETDPKKYIQQLTGKLSQTLNSYNNENGEPDVELGKYVLGMLVKQGTKGMDDKDRKEIIKKLNTSNSDDEMEMDDEVPEEDMENDVETNDLNMQTESKIIKCTKKQIFENFGIAMDSETPSNAKKEPDTKIPNDTKRNRRTRPFEAPKKFKE